MALYLSHSQASRNISLLTMNRPSTTTHRDKEWPVQLYRYTECDGWQKQAGTKDTSAAPRKDCIVIPCLRQKFSLISAATTTSAKDGNGSSTPGDRTYVIRRDRCILMVSKRRMRALVLQFRTLQDCLDFSDKFLELNPFERIEEQDKANHQVASSRPAGLADQEEVVSYMARMLHDQDFLGFVHKIETYMKNTTDGIQLLDSLAANVDDGQQQKLAADNTLGV